MSALCRIEALAEHAKEEARAGRTADARLDLMLDQIAKNMVRQLIQADHFRRRFARILSAIRRGQILP
jgi:hypothetical protein